MTDSMHHLLHRARVMRLFTVAGGTLLGEVALAGFKAAGGSAHLKTESVAIDDAIASTATWGELVDDDGTVIAVGPLGTRSAGRSD